MRRFHEHEVSTCKAHLATSPKQVGNLEIISKTIGYLDTRRTGTAEMKAHIIKSEKESGTGGIFSGKNPLDSRSTSFRYCQTRVVVIPWKARIAEPSGEFS